MYCRVIFADISLTKRWREVTGCSRLCAQSCNRAGLIFQSKAGPILPSAAAQLLVYLILASKRWIPADRLSTGHTHTLTVFADFADPHMVSSQFSPTRGDDFEISSLPSFYSPLGRGRIDHRHRTLLLPSLL
jgi:hypothetical protein